MIVLVANQATSDELPVISDKSQTFTFAVLGDTHYTPPGYKVTPFIHDIAREIDSQPRSPAFICHTGDVVEGGVYEIHDGKRKFVLASYEEMKSQLGYATHDLEQAFHRPVFIAVGNHDKHDPGYRAYREIALPLISKGLKQPLDRTYYAFRYANACLLFLDFAPRDYDEQARFAGEVLAKAKNDPRVQHIFFFAHFPLWPVVRAGFYSPRFTDSVLPLIRTYAPDAFFCGHTHNTLVCVRKVENLPIVQIQGVSTGRGQTLLPIEQHNALLVPPAELPYCWGYREGSPTGYYLVHVDGPKVDVQWRIPGHGLVHEFAWRQPGKLTDVKRPMVNRIPVTDEALRGAQSAELVFCPWNPQRMTIRVSINGEEVARKDLPPTYTPFWEETHVAIAKENLKVLRRNNLLTIDNPGRAVFGFAAARLELVLRDGSLTATPVANTFHFSCRAGQVGQPSMTKAWQAVPANLRREVDLGQPLGPVELRF